MAQRSSPRRDRDAPPRNGAGSPRGGTISSREGRLPCSGGAASPRDRACSPQHGSCPPGGRESSRGEGASPPGRRSTSPRHGDNPPRQGEKPVLEGGGRGRPLRTQLTGTARSASSAPADRPLQRRCGHSYIFGDIFELLGIIRQDRVGDFPTFLSAQTERRRQPEGVRWPYSRIFTSIRPRSPVARRAGLYMASTCTGGRRKLPGATARTRV